ncbi:MAG: hypothetical protein PHG04_01030 [Candidatus Nanoarchaeia archaeon]|nr:hypothetical protein [Candidatus Nanoarchaeia archaeon]MDD5053945.1 hypothetical protein [Candidatus Nanoarchaeia archaeon]
MGLFDKKNESIGFPQKGGDDNLSFPEPPESIDDSGLLNDVKSSVESSSSFDEDDWDKNDLGSKEKKIEEPLSEKKMESSYADSASFGKKGFSDPILYIKISEYKEVVQATNKMRKDIEKAKSIVGELRTIEKDEHSKLEKSEEVIAEVESAISLFEKVMVTPVE